MLLALITLVVGFIAGALVFRNNKDKAEAIIAKADAMTAAEEATIRKFLGR